MFFGSALKPGESTTLTNDAGDILHISQACLHNPEENSSSCLIIENEGNAFDLCRLSKSTCPHAQLDLFVAPANGVKLSVKGNTEIHVSGYYEPKDDGMDFEDESDEEVSVTSKTLDSGAKKTLGTKGFKKEETKKSVDGLNKKKALLPTTDEDDDDDDLDDFDDSDTGVGNDEGNDDDDDDDDQGDDDDEDDDDDDDEGLELSDDEEDDEDDADAGGASVPSKKFGKNIKQDAGSKKSEVKNFRNIKIGDNLRGPQGKKSGQQQKQTKLPDKPGKRKFDSSPTSNADSKKSKANDGTTTTFERDIVNFLKANGKTAFSALGSKIKKPANVDRISQFIKDRPNVFVVDNGMVSLKK